VKLILIMHFILPNVSKIPSLQHEINLGAPGILKNKTKSPELKKQNRTKIKHKSECINFPGKGMSGSEVCCIDH